MSIRIVVAGAAGKMGRAMCAGILREQDLELAAAVDVLCRGLDIGELAGLGHAGVAVEADLRAALERERPDVLLEFTGPAAVYDNTRLGLELGVPVVVGATGLSEAQVAELDVLARERYTPLFAAPNFAVGAVLLMRFAAEAARYLPAYEVLEVHNEKKADAPSGTSMLTLSLMKQQRQGDSLGAANSAESVAGCRGGLYAGARVHSLRLPGVVAIEEVLFGAEGQTLSLRHESISRDSFFPGVALALRRAPHLPPGLTLGLDKLMWGADNTDEYPFSVAE